MIKRNICIELLIKLKINLERELSIEPEVHMTKFKKVLIYIFAIIVGCASLVFFLGDPAKGLLEGSITKDIILRKNFIVETLSTGPSPADFFLTENAQYAGEWTIGTYAMATYALTNIAMLEPETAKESSKIIAQWIEFCIDEKVATFDEIAWGEKPLDKRVLRKDKGHIGYYGHLNLMIGCYALLNNDGRFEALHRKISAAIARRMKKYPHRHIETYPGETYPPDNTVAVASLRVADMTLRTNYKRLIDEWVEQSKKIEYPPYGLIVFEIDIKTARPLQTTRGSNIGWNSFFLPLIDEEYAQVQFKRFKKHMLRQCIGFAAFKEYPQGQWFRADRDTGPVIFGLGASATGFSIAGARWTNDESLLTALLRSIELFGISITKGNQRKYAVAPVVGDAILLAMKTACRWRPLWKNPKQK
ncbi:MAG: hypothetical protein JSW40_00520 [Candidatus Omnitrophota bacterium]|nr:MAG: hypothetical protein JSW40_00520 [Candidatus Omnitrophota bacterium]